MLWGASCVMILCITEFPDLQKSWILCYLMGELTQRLWMTGIESWEGWSLFRLGLAASWSVLAFSQGNLRVVFVSTIFLIQCDSCCPHSPWGSTAQMFCTNVLCCLRQCSGAQENFTLGLDTGVPALLGQWLVLGFSFLLFLCFSSLGLTVSFSINSAQMWQRAAVRIKPSL